MSPDFCPQRSRCDQIIDRAQELDAWGNTMMSSETAAAALGATLRISREITALFLDAPPDVAICADCPRQVIVKPQ